MQCILRRHHAAVVGNGIDLQPIAVRIQEFDCKWLRVRYATRADAGAVEVQVDQPGRQRGIRREVNAAKRVGRWTEHAGRPFGHHEVTKLGGLRAVCGVHESRSRGVGGGGDAESFKHEAGGRFVQVQNVLLKVAGGICCLIPRHCRVALIVHLHARHVNRQLAKPSRADQGAQHQRNCAPTPCPCAVYH